MKKRLLSLALCTSLFAAFSISCNDNKQEIMPTEKPEPTGTVDIAGSSADPNNWIYLDQKTNIMIREATFDSGLGGDPVTIAQLTDLHFNYCNSKDFRENNPSVMSTYEHREWLRGGVSVGKAVNCLKYAEKADQIIITGDVLDYISWGNIDLMKKNIWDKYPDTLVCLGNHESIRVCQGKVEDPTTFESRLELLQEHWPHDIFYTSKVIKDKVMVIQMDNASDNDFPGRFWECQIEPLTNDLALAREKGYVVLLFYHIPIATNNTEQGVVSPIRGNAGSNAYFANYGTSHNADTASAAVYDLIVNNADVIKGAFCGHLHSDYYTEIVAKTSDGTDAIIPQYILTGVPYDEGHIMWITVK